MLGSFAKYDVCDDQEHGHQKRHLEHEVAQSFSPGFIEKIPDEKETQQYDRRYHSTPVGVLLDYSTDTGISVHLSSLSMEEQYPRPPAGVPKTTLRVVGRRQRESCPDFALPLF